MQSLKNLIVLILFLLFLLILFGIGIYFYIQLRIYRNTNNAFLKKEKKEKMIYSIVGVAATGFIILQFIEFVSH